MFFLGIAFALDGLASVWGLVGAGEVGCPVLPCGVKLPVRVRWMSWVGPPWVVVLRLGALLAPRFCWGGSGVVTVCG